MAYRIKRSTGRMHLDDISKMMYHKPYNSLRLKQKDRVMRTFLTTVPED